MPDPLAGQGQPSPLDIEKIIADRLSDFERTRVAGFQRLISERENENDRLKAQLRDQRLASLPEDERATAMQQDQADEIARLRVQLEVKDLYGEFAAEAPFFERIIQAESTADQLRALRAFRESLTAPVAPPPPPPAPGTVDLNRPGSATTPSSFQDGTPMDEAMADALLAGSSRDTLAQYTRS